MTVVAIIPARYGSTRFPGKPLARHTGKFLIQHVAERVREADRIDRVIVATDDQRIRDAVLSFGGEAVMTRSDHRTGTDRIAEVIRGLDGRPDDIVVNVQGDEPEIEPSALDRLVTRLAEDHECSCATLACPFPEDGSPDDPHCVKVVCDSRRRALYFSRSRIPFPRVVEDQTPRDAWLLHQGVYAFRRAFLLEFAGWEPTPLERIESLEQLRVLENGRSMAVEIIERAFPGVDTPEDYERFVARQRGRP